MHRLQPTVLYMRIDLSRLNAGVPQQLLQSANVRAPGQHVGRKAMTQRMRADLWVAANSRGVAFDEPPYHDPRHRTAAPRDEQPVV